MLFSKEDLLRCAKLYAEIALNRTLTAAELEIARKDVEKMQPMEVPTQQSYSMGCIVRQDVCSICGQHLNNAACAHLGADLPKTNFTDVWLSSDKTV